MPSKIYPYWDFRYANISSGNHVALTFELYGILGEFSPNYIA
jgi:hypothetical protein